MDFTLANPPNNGHSLGVNKGETPPTTTHDNRSLLKGSEGSWIVHVGTTREEGGGWFSGYLTTNFVFQDSK